MALSLATLTLRREGLFNQAVDGDHHCGPKSALVDMRIPEEPKAHAKGRPVQGARGLGANMTTRTVKGIPVRYNLTVACGPVLDHRGFLFDQAMVDVWFARQGERPTSLSCEAYAIRLANTFMDKLAKDAPHCDLRGVTLQLSPAPHTASISAHFTRGTNG